ncbi:hypothetical protein HPB49_001079 [Dermacentor silvarum]|uniref:Uncharacterized protein n=1 Tax=Dermacentor silvarum TaxID=543639 RepID=A0ACB8CJ23_DERSI|nr:hypothetical protein HPB49_001079 [Dermacentor silvarum]
MPPSPSQLVDPSKDSAEAEVAELARQNAEAAAERRSSTSSDNMTCSSSSSPRVSSHPASRTALDGPTPHVLQWNCRGLGTCAVKLNLFFDCVRTPSSASTSRDQWHRSDTTKVQWLLPTVNRASKQETGTETPQPNGIAGAADEFVIRGQAAVFVRTDIPQTQIDTCKYSTAVQEVVAVRCKIAKRNVVLVSVYMLPEVSSRTRDSFTWIRALRRCYPNDNFLIGGDFNAKHPQWGYDYHTPRGTALVDATETTDLVLANDTDYTTRAALHSGQRNTTPDLTLSTPDIVKDWRCDPDAWGSDHYPLWITLNMGRKCAAGRTVRTIRWDAYRRAFSEQPKTASVRERASHALRMATTETEVRADAPAPDIHMLNLWDARKRAQLTYVENGRRHRDRVRLRRRTAVARRYAKCLYRERWSQHCSSINERTGLHKVPWYTFKARNRSPNADIYRKTQPVTDEGLQGPILALRARTGTFFYKRAQRTRP